MNVQDSAPGTPQRQLDSLLSRAAARWRVRGALLDLAATLLAVSLVVAATAWTVAAQRYAGGVVGTARTLVWLLAGFALAAWLVAVARRRMSRQQAAGYLERHAPALDGVLLTAVAGAATGAGGLWRAVVASAVEQCHRLDVVGTTERTRLRRAASAVGAVLLLAMAALLLAPPSLRHAVALLLPGSDPHAPAPFTIDVAPGSATLVAGADLRVTARATGFEPETATLQWRRRGDTAWTPMAMLGEQDGRRFEAYLFDVGAPLEYRVDADGVLSPVYTVEVLPRPSVQRIDLTYEFPPESGRAPQSQPDGGPITAVRGTRVTLEVSTDTPVSTGRLVLDDNRHIPLVADADGRLRALLEVLDDGHYRVELDAGDGRMIAASPEYPIAALVDRPPVVEIRRPGRDTQVTRIEELQIEVRARDDLAVHDLELVLSVNGERDEVLPLGGDATPSVIARTLLAMEERTLEPGDLIAFHARARDGDGASAQAASSDLYFIEVRPFDRSYRRADGGGGGGGGGGGDQQQAGLAEQQRELVIALFNVLRDGIPDADTETDRAGLFEQAQARVRDRVDAIVRRLGTRPVVEMNPGYRAMAEELPRASAAMVRVEALLAGRDIGAALEPARQALRHLQRADAAFREVQVARQMAGAQGGAGASEAGDLANLFALEMDRSRSQYSSVQRGRWDQPERAEQDRLAQRMRELAERQQREVERLDRRRQQGMDGAGGAGGSGRGDVASQRELAEELERVARELERLSLARPEDRALAESLAQVREAARSMQQAAAEGDGEAGRAALESLRGAGRSLDGGEQQRLADGVASAHGEAERLAREQRETEQSLAGPLDAADAERAGQRKDDMQARVEALREQVEGLADAARDDASGAGRDLRAAADALGEERLSDALERSRRRLAATPPTADAATEAMLGETLEQTRDRLAAAGQALGQAPGETPGEAGDATAERLAELVAGLEAAQRRLAGQSTTGQPSSGDQADAQSGAQAGAPGAAGGASAGGGAVADGSDGGGYGRASGASIGGGGAIGYSGPLPPFREAIAGGVRDLDRVRRSLRDESRAARDIEQLIAGLQDLVEDRMASPQHTLERHAELLERLQRVRQALADGGDRGPPPLLAREGQLAPPGWEQRVDDYFRGLADGER